MNVRFWHFLKNLTNFDPLYKKFHNRIDINTHPLSNFLPKNEIPEGCNLCMTIIEYFQDLSFRLDIQTKLQLSNLLATSEPPKYLNSNSPNLLL